MRERERLASTRRAQLSSALHADRVEYGAHVSNTRVEAKRMQREAQMRENAAREAAAAVEREAAREAMKRRREEEVAFANELERRKSDAERDARMRQLIREDSAELRALQSRLKAAYLSKERAAQMAEKELAFKARVAEEQMRDQQLLREWQHAFVDEDKRMAENAARKDAYRASLEDQLVAKEAQKEAEYQEFIREKAMIDEIVAKIQAEDEASARARLERQRETREYIDEFMRQRQAIKAAERARLEAENVEISAYIKQQEERKSRFEAKRREQDALRERVREQQSAAIAQQEASRRELEDLRQELHWEEQEAAARAKEKAAMEKRIRQRLELQASYEAQMAAKARIAESRREEEEAFRVQMLAKFAEDEKLEQMAAAKRRRRQIEHRKEVDALIAQRRAAYHDELAAEADRRKQEEEFAAYRARIVEEERQALIREHASRLLGYIPKGVLRDERDISLLPPDVQDQFRASPAPYAAYTTNPPFATAPAPTATATAPSEGNFLTHTVNSAHSAYVTTNQASYASPSSSSVQSRRALPSQDYRHRPFNY